MQKLEALTAYLVNKSGLDVDSVKAQIEHMALKPQGSDEGNQILLHTMRYQAAISVIGFVYQTDEIARFNAHLMSWLVDQDEMEPMADKLPEIQLDWQDANTANLALNLTFEEAVYISPDQGGEIEYAGNTWQLAMADKDVALTFELQADIAN